LQQHQLGYELLKFEVGAQSQGDSPIHNALFYLRKHVQSESSSVELFNFFITTAYIGVGINHMHFIILNFLYLKFELQLFFTRRARGGDYF
jgi:hypothetical protein